MGDFMSIVIRTFLIALLFAGIIFILGANNVFSIKDDVADFSLDPIDSSVAVNINPNRDAFFGDLHVHTMYSFDAFIFGTTASPDDAYKYAKGGSIKHPLGFDMQLDDPLDFYAITDHAAWLGMIRAYADPDSKPGQLDFAADLHGLNDHITKNRKKSNDELDHFDKQALQRAKSKIKKGENL